MKNLAGLMKQASQMQTKMEELQRGLESAEIEGQSGAGMVRVTLSGKGVLRGVKIDAKLMDPAETEMLEDLLIAAHHDAKQKADEHAATEMGKLTGGLDLPPGLKLPF